MSVETFADMNYLAVLAGAIAYFAVGGLWYSPVLFARPWMESSGVNPQRGQGMAGLMIGTFLLQLLTVLVLAFLARELGAAGLGDAVLLGLVTGVGIAAVSLVVNQLYESRPVRLMLITSGYNVVGILVAAIVVTLWA